MNPFRRRNKDLDDEIEAHLRMAEQDRLDRGETGAQARLGARREFGNQGIIKEVTREMWGWNGLRNLARDLHYAVRMLRKNPGFTAVVAGTLALGIGANTAIFSTMRAALVPAAVPGIDRTVMVWTENLKRDEHQFPASVPDFQDWKSSGLFSSLAAFDQAGYNLRAGDVTERVDGVSVTADFFSVLAASPQLGRVFGPQDMQPGLDQVAILSNGLWRSKFAGDRSVVGSTAVVDGIARTIVGVLPANFPRYGKDPIYCPLVFTPTAASDRGTRHYLVLGRLQNGIALEAAQKKIDVISARLAEQYLQDLGQSARLQPLEEAYVEDARYILMVLFGAVGFVLLIACANVANLVLARGASRAREMVVRAALGASRWQLSRQLLTESLLLSLFAGGLAILPAMGAMKLIASARYQLVDAGSIPLDWRVLTFNLALSVATGVLFGLVPAWQVRKVQVHDALKASGRSVAGGRRQRIRGLLVVSELALTLVLLAGAGLMARTFWRLRSAYPGYDTRGVLTMKVALSTRQYPEGDKQPAFFARVLEQATRLPGVQSAGAIDDLPTSDNLHGTGLLFPDRPEPRREDTPMVLRNRVMGDYFAAMSMPLLRGRYLNVGDRKESPAVAVIDQWTAQHFWPNQDPVGKPFRFGRKDVVRHVVGVVGNVDFGVAVTVLKGRVGQFYLPAEQSPSSLMSLVLRTEGDPSQLISPMRGAVRGVDIDQPTFDVMTLTAVRAAGSTLQELASMLLAGFATMALLLAAIGIYGVMACSVSQRTREFGIRMSLGAQPGDVLRMVIGRGIVLTAAGIALGLAGAFGLTRLMQDLLFGVQATDPLTFAAVAALLAAVTLFAGYLPARRATQVDPVLALREE